MLNSLGKKAFHTSVQEKISNPSIIKKCSAVADEIWAGRNDATLAVHKTSSTYACLPEVFAKGFQFCRLLMCLTRNKLRKLTYFLKFRTSNTVILWVIQTEFVEIGNGTDYRLRLLLSELFYECKICLGIYYRGCVIDFCLWMAPCSMNICSKSTLLLTLTNSFTLTTTGTLPASK